MLSADVISHQRPRRKRVSAWACALRGALALAITAAALLTATWLTTPREPAAPRLSPPPNAALESPAPSAVLPEVDVAIDRAGPPPRRSRPAHRTAAAGIPLNAQAEAASDGYEILSAAELDAISQARD